MSGIALKRRRPVNVPIRALLQKGRLGPIIKVEASCSQWRLPIFACSRSPAGLNVLDKLQSIEVLGRAQGRIQGKNEDSLIKMGQAVAPNAFRLLAQLAGLFNRTHPDPCEMIPMVRAITGMGVQAGTELSRPGCVGDLLPV